MLRNFPSVSVIIPTYNRQQYVLQAVESVLAQTYNAWELIVVDDGSNDSTIALLATIQDTRIRTICCDHCGNPAHVRNVGIENARGQYVAFLDSDDLWQADKLRLQIESLRRNTNARWSYTRYIMVDSTGMEISARAGKPWQSYSGFILSKLATDEAAAPIQTVLVERDLLLEVGLLDEELLFREDYDLVFRLAARAEVLAVPEVLCQIREHTGRSSSRCDDPHGWTARVYGKLRNTALDSSIRHVADRKYAYHLTEAAAWHAAAGSWRLTVNNLIRALRSRPLYGHWWVVLVKCLLSPILRLFRNHSSKRFK